MSWPGDPAAFMAGENETGFLEPETLAALMADENAPAVTSFDDLFDEPMYRACEVVFRGQPHRLAPQGQTYYRPAVDFTSQGFPPDLESAHWNYLPAARWTRNPSVRRPPASRGASVNAPPYRFHDQRRQ